MSGGKFVTAINCMDGRVQLPVLEYLKAKSNAAYVDVITDPAPVKLLAERVYLTMIERVKKALLISITKHGSTLVAVVAHHDCAANPAPKETQVKQVQAAVKLVEAWALGPEVIGLWVDEHWQVHEVK